ncbi:MAG TPA: branched-chain amino acid ABC transporter permease [Anaeromyxobacteraceae bacterium]|nr:branched-chain amino acid ABC transporter permease [Anaeromyxobacteraceae bacterium]
MDLVESYREELRFVRKPLGRTLLALLLVALALLPWWGERSWLARASLVWLFAIGVVGQNLLIGYAGLISFGQAGFLAIGAYAFGHLRIAGVPFPVALAAAGGAAGLAGWIVGFPSLRLKGPYLAIATLGFGTATYQIFANVEWLSGGRTGLAIPALRPPPGFTRDTWVYLVYYALFLLFTGTAYNLVSSFVGRAFVAIRDSDVAAEAMGVNLARYKLLAFGISSFFTGVSGALMAQYLGHLEPQAFNVAESMNFFVAVIVGGLASVEGSVFGAAFVVLVPALLGAFRWAVPVLFGSAILGVLIFEPLGFAGMWLKARLYFRLWPFR